MTLNQLVAEFRKVDRAIIALIAKRMQLAAHMGKLKKKLGIPVKNVKREKEAIYRARKLAHAKKLNPDVVEKVMKTLIKASRDIQHHA